jgi:hypothetical protein
MRVAHMVDCHIFWMGVAVKHNHVTVTCHILTEKASKEAGSG